eukprot:TRINITY_DN12104_c0_g1_i1.p1 TRINITY_DN12104_c0_g1~~TRINITY_DN12104_c0_g1_i1.p1  ORF type:complete len:140 (+),score=14.91 TRINITY_DN12104_c0_g1_i1:444-863(+)
MKSWIFVVNALVEGGFGIATLVRPAGFLFQGINDVGEAASLWFGAAILSQGVASYLMAKKPEDSGKRSFAVSCIVYHGAIAFLSFYRTWVVPGRICSDTTCGSAALAGIMGVLTHSLLGAGFAYYLYSAPSNVIKSKQN